MMARLRAALTPQVLIVLAASLLLFGFLVSSGDAAGRASALETRISKALSAIDGAGEVQVVIVTKSGGAQAASAFSAPAQQEEIATGAVAVAQGADDPLVRMELTQALCSLLNLPASCVSVMAGGK